jgi:hypothetical protein
MEITTINAATARSRSPTSPSRLPATILRRQMRWIPIMNRMIPRKAKLAIATFTQIDISIDNMIPPWRGKSPSIPLTTHLNDCPVFRYTPFYLKNKFNVKRKHIDHRKKA